MTAPTTLNVRPGMGLLVPLVPFRAVIHIDREAA
jgi:hypothetical protein